MLMSDMQVGQTKKVVAMNNDEKTKRRLNNMGLTKGVKVTLVRIAPFGCPLEIKVRDFYMAIRKDQAKKIEVGEP